MALLTGLGRFKLTAGLRSLGEGGGLPVAAPYLGQVSTGSRLPTFRHSAETYSRGRTLHKATDDITTLKLGFLNWQLTSPGSTPAGTGEVDGLAAYAINASVEYPLGSEPTVATFSGAAQGSVAPGELKLSDYVAKTIPKGSTYAVRTHRASASALHCVQGSTLNWQEFGNYYEASASALTDFTASSADPGTSAGAASGQLFPPALIIAPTRQPSVMVWGDSIAFGIGGSVDSEGATGIIIPSLPNIGYCLAGNPGDRATYANTGSPRRRALLPYFSHMISEFGINDISVGNNAAATMAALQTIYNFGFGKPVFQSTISPRNDHTTGQKAQWAALNDLIRATPSPLAGYFEIADVLSDGRNVDAYADAGDVADGIQHPSTQGYLKVRNSGAIDPSRIVRAVTPTLRERFTVKPSTLRQNLADDFINGLIADDVWAYLDGFDGFALATQLSDALLNWKNAAYNGIVSGGVSAIDGIGVQGNGTNGQINPQFSLASSNLKNMTTTSGCIGVVLPDNAASDAQVIGTIGASPIVYLLPRTVGNAALMRFLDADGAALTVTGITDSSGHWMGARNGTARELYRNNSLLGSDVQSSAGTSSTLLLLGNNNTIWSSRRVSAAYWGAYLNAARRTALHNRLVTLMQGLGVPGF